MLKIFAFYIINLSTFSVLEDGIIKLKFTYHSILMTLFSLYEKTNTILHILQTVIRPDQTDDLSLYTRV